MADYVDVKERIKLFYQSFPEGSIQFEFKGVLESNPDMIWGIAYAYRTPDDPRPGIGTAAELAVGKTTFTRGSELMNLETSAWGRAIASLGIGLGKSVATKQEVESAQARQNDPWENPTEGKHGDKVNKATYTQLMTDKQFRYIKACFNGNMAEMQEFVDTWKDTEGIAQDVKLDINLASKLIEKLKELGYQPVFRGKHPDPESRD